MEKGQLKKRPSRRAGVAQSHLECGAAELLASVQAEWDSETIATVLRSEEGEVV